MVDYINKSIELRHRLHQIPEPSMYEVQTKAALMDFISAESNLEIIDMGSWFYVAYRYADDATSIAFRADFDAVTGEDGISRHLCGHDGHASILAGLALWIAETKPQKNIFLIFQPGEESGKGAKVCCDIFEREEIDEIYGLHNIPGKHVGSVLIKYGTFAAASVGLEIAFKGAPAHAAYPEFGRNPARAISELIIQMDDWVKQAHRGMVLSTVIGIDAGSDRYGVSASEGTLRLTVRAEYADEFDQLLLFIKDKIAILSDTYGLVGTIVEHERFPSTENHTICVDKLRKMSENCGLDMEELPSLFRWSEDFGWYLQQVPGAFFGIGSGERCPELHTADYEFPDEIIEDALRVFQGLIIA